MAEAYDTRGARRRALAAKRDADIFPLNDLPNDVLVSVFMAVEDPIWVRHTFPLVCKAWEELYLSKDASPLHETLEINFLKEVRGAEASAAAREEEEEGRRDPVEGAPLRPPVVHASRVIEWAQAQGRAGSVRKLCLMRYNEDDEMTFRDHYTQQVALEDFSAEDFGALVAVVGSSLTEISIGFGLEKLCKGPFWESLRTSVVPAGRLRSLKIEDIDADTFRSDLEPLLGQLAGSLEELALETAYCGEPFEEGLPRFPESLFALKELRSLVLYGHPEITAIPAEISSLKKLKELKVTACDLSSLPRELVDLSGLTKLDINDNRGLGNTLPSAEAFPAELGRMKSLRDLDLCRCDLRTVPAFVRELKSLESLALGACELSSLPKELGQLSGLTKLDLSWNKSLGTTLPAAAAFPAELGRMKSLRDLDLCRCDLRTVPAFVVELKSLESLNLSYNNDLQFDAPLDFLLEGCPRLREVRLSKSYGAGPWTPESRAHLEAFKAKLRAKNPDAEVLF